MKPLANTGGLADTIVPNPTDSRDFLSSAGWKNLRLRAELLKRLRGFFERHGFLEVETPILSADTVVDRHLDPLWTTLEPHAAGDGEAASPSRRLWLQTSPEFSMKRLLAADGPAVYQVTRSFRAGEQGPLHNPEFTIVEWYRPGDDMERGMALTGRLCEAMLDRGPAERMAYGEAFRRHVGVDPHTADGGALIEAAERHGLHPPESLSPDDRDGWLDLLLVALVQPHLGRPRPVLLYDYPAGQAALARVRPGPRRLPNGSSCTSPASNWPTATTNCSIRTNCGGAIAWPTNNVVPTASRRCPNRAGC